MEGESPPLATMATASKNIVRDVLAMGENRLELLMVELQEERERVFHSLLLLMAVMTFALLTGLAFTVLMVALFWRDHPQTGALVLTLFYGGCSGFLYYRFQKLMHAWRTLPETLEQLRRDHAALKNYFA